MEPLMLFQVIIISLLLIWIFSLQKDLANMKELEKKHWTRAESNVMTNKVLIMWVDREINKGKVVDYFHKHNISRIAIYGMTDMGMLLYKLLKNTDIVVVNGIDRGKKLLNLPFEIVRPYEFHENVDAIIIASFYYFSEIYDVLRKHISGDVPIVGLDEIVYEIAEE